MFAFKKPRPSTDTLNPVQVLRKKKDLKAADPIVDTHHEITHEGKQNPNYDKTVLGPDAQMMKLRRDAKIIQNVPTASVPVPVIHPEYHTLKANTTVVLNKDANKAGSRMTSPRMRKDAKVTVKKV